MSPFENIGKVELFYLKLFRIFGFVPLALNHQANTVHYLLLVWSLLQIGINLLKLYISYVYFEKVVYTLDGLGEIHDIAKLTMLNLTHQTLLMDAIFNRQKLRDFFSKLSLLQRIYLSDTIERREENKRRNLKYVLKFCSFILYTAFAETKMILSVLHLNQFINYWILTNLNYVPVSLFNLYCIFLMDMVHLEQVRLNMELRSLTKFTIDTNTCKCSRNFDDAVRVRIISAQKRHQLIFGIVQDLNEIFGLFWTMDALCYLVMCQYCVYWIYFQLYQSKHYGLIEAILIVLPALVILWCTLKRSQDCMDEAKCTTFEVHNLDCANCSDPLAIQIQNFSLQLAHERIIFTAKGFFPVNVTILKSIFALITMYMCFFIQLMPDYMLALGKEDQT